MRTAFCAFLFGGVLVRAVLARDIPENVRAFYDRVKAGNCSDELAGGFFDTSDPDGGERAPILTQTIAERG